MSMSKTTLIETIAEQLEMPKAQVERVLNAEYDTIAKTLRANRKDGDYKIQIMGFGTFRASFVEGREGRNPQKPEETIQIPDSYRIYFSAGKKFKDEVNGAAAPKKAAKKADKAASKKAAKKTTKKGKK